MDDAVEPPAQAAWSGRLTGSSQIDQVRFPRVGGGYESPDYATAANRIDIDLSGGVGSVRIVGGAT